jgi:hypothetical protein
MAPKGPMMTVKKVADKVAGKKGAKAPFLKPRKAPSLKTKPESWS